MYFNGVVEVVDRLDIGLMKFNQSVAIFFLKNTQSQILEGFICLIHIDQTLQIQFFKNQYLTVFIDVRQGGFVQHTRNILVKSGIVSEKRKKNRIYYEY